MAKAKATDLPNLVLLSYEGELREQAYKMDWPGRSYSRRQRKEKSKFSAAPL
jgi:hypothetical protein